MSLEFLHRKATQAIRTKETANTALERLMTLLILGLALWAAGHIWHRFAPDFYAGLGKAAYGVSAGVIVLALAVMIVGYRGAAFVPIWSPPAFLTHLNNLLMVFAIYTYLASATRSGTAWIVGNLRHPQLTGVKIWAVAHLLVNGDLASILLFTGILAWAVLEVILINRQDERTARSTAPISSPYIHLGLTLGVVIVVMMLHLWLGVSPFG